jgi:hypothetical protein
MEASTRGDPVLYSQRLTPVTTFLKCLFEDTWVRAIQKASPDVWQTLNNSYINFSHFTEDIAHKDAYDSLTAEGLMASFVRGGAIQCKQGQCGIDLVIPMIVLPPSRSIYSPVSVLDISAIIFQIKNKRKDSGTFNEQFLKKNRFDLSHIPGVTATGSRPYVAIWMSFGTDQTDFCIEGHAKTFKPDCESLLIAID